MYKMRIAILLKQMYFLKSQTFSTFLSRGPINYKVNIFVGQLLFKLEWKMENYLHTISNNGKTYIAVLPKLEWIKVP